MPPRIYNFFRGFLMAVNHDDAEVQAMVEYIQDVQKTECPLIFLKFFIHKELFNFNSV